jgi:hypothetical protein
MQLPYNLGSIRLLSTGLNGKERELTPLAVQTSAGRKKVCRVPSLTSGGRTLSERSLLPRDLPCGVADRIGRQAAQGLQHTRISVQFTHLL